MASAEKLQRARSAHKSPKGPCEASSLGERERVRDDLRAHALHQKGVLGRLRPGNAQLQVKPARLARLGALQLGQNRSTDSADLRGRTLDPSPSPSQTTAQTRRGGRPAAGASCSHHVLCPRVAACIKLRSQHFCRRA